MGAECDMIRNNLMLPYEDNFLNRMGFDFSIEVIKILLTMKIINLNFKDAIWKNFRG